MNYKLFLLSLITASSFAFGMQQNNPLTALQALEQRRHLVRVVNYRTFLHTPYPHLITYVVKNWKNSDNIKVKLVQEHLLRVVKKAIEIDPEFKRTDNEFIDSIELVPKGRLKLQLDTFESFLALAPKTDLSCAAEITGLEYHLRNQDSGT